jgi:hypothetical protein
MQEYEVLDMLAHERKIIEAAYSDLLEEMWTPIYSTDYVHGRMGLRLCESPHDDHLMLHAPGLCDLCDRREDWQLARIRLSVAFTGDNMAWIAKRPDPWSLTMMRGEE